MVIPVDSTDARELRELEEARGAYDDVGRRMLQPPGG